MIWAKTCVTSILYCRHWRRWSREVPACCWDSWPARENYWERCSNPITRLSQRFSLQSGLGLLPGHWPCELFCLISEELGVMNLWSQVADTTKHWFPWIFCFLTPLQLVCVSKRVWEIDHWLKNLPNLQISWKAGSPTSIATFCSQFRRCFAQKFPFCPAAFTQTSFHSFWAKSTRQKLSGSPIYLLHSSQKFAFLKWFRLISE